MKRIIILIILVIIITACSSFNSKEIENSINIKSLNLNNKYSISSVKDNVEGIVLFIEFGKPDLENSNTVIGAHSGFGSNAYFNFLLNVKEKSEIFLYYNGLKYKYFVEKVEIVDKSEIDILNNKNYSTLTLISCNIYNLDERIIVISRLEG